MAFRSHFRNPPLKDATASQPERKSSSRIPAKTSKSSTENEASKATQHVSKLSKRTSRSITPSDKTSVRTSAVEKPMTATMPARGHAPPPKQADLPSSSRSAPSAALRPSRSQLEHSAPPRPSNMRTPSLVSGSSSSAYDSPKTTGLRRKPSTIEDYAASRKAEGLNVDNNGTTAQRREHISEEFEDTVLGISFPQTTSYAQDGGYITANARYRLPLDSITTDQPVTRDITPPVHSYAPSATPSTRYTDSPFSHVPTPSSASSYSSSAIATTTGLTPRLRQQSPTRACPSPNVRGGDKGDSARLGLPTLRESSTSSSNTTVKSTGITASTSKHINRKPVTTASSSTTSDTPRVASRGRPVTEKAKETSTTSKIKPPLQIPPELAHLNVEPARADLNKSLPPVRPSREGTPIITGMTSPSPVVQSDLPQVYNTYHKRTPSQESTNPASPLKSRFGLHSRTPSRESPRIDSAISPPPAARSFARGPTPDAQPSERPRLIRKDSPAVGPAPSPSKSPRFGFFSRKPKDGTPKVPEKPKRQPTKGPAAGTGHEGYGRFGIRGRSGSSTSSTGVRSTSADSTTSSQAKRNSQSRKSSVASNGPQMDDFLRERMNPIVLRGSGSTLSNTASVSDTASTLPNSKTSSLDSYTKPQLLPSAIPSDAGPSPTKMPYPRGRAPSESSEDDVNARYPTLAGRRSLTRLSQGDNKLQVRLPTPISTGRPSKDSSLDSFDAERWAPPRSDTAPPIVESPARINAPTPEKEKSSRRWNFFQRAHASPKSKGKEKAGTTNEVPAVTLQQMPRVISPYTMLETVEPVDLEEVERIVQEIETSPEDSMSESAAPPKLVPYEGRHKSLLPPPPQTKPTSSVGLPTRPNMPGIALRREPSTSSSTRATQYSAPRSMPQNAAPQRMSIVRESSNKSELHPGYGVQQPQQSRDVRTPEMACDTLNTPENMEDSPQRQPRLSPVGRIPKVVSKRDRDRKLSDNSFSRPFGRSQPRPTVQPPGSLYNQIRELASPIESGSGSQPVSSTSTRSDNNSGGQKSSNATVTPSITTNRTSMDMPGGEFFAFPPRKDSDLSYSSGSGYNSWLAGMAPPVPQEEDVWHEYNDLLDDVMTMRSPLSTSSSFGAPFQYSDALQEPQYVTSYPPNWTQPPWQELPQLPPANIIPSTNPAVLSVPQQIARFMQPSMSPLTTPNQLADFVDHYGNRSTSTLITSNRNSVAGPRRPSLAPSNRSSIPVQTQGGAIRNSRSSLPSARGSMASSRHSRGSAHSRSASLPEVNARNSQSSLAPSVRFNRETQLLDIAEVEGDDQVAAANLRFGALMTSKWLSFGRVLFSPADNEMRLADDPKLLIIDGLGSDWSYYVALTYPSATVYNLGPPPPNGSAWPGVNQKPPANHRHINHTAISAAFPFPKGFFSAVVFRFPLVTTEEAYHSCIFECKRVLRPGGYLEVAVLDLDLMNMGSRARNAVRGLKIRMLNAGQDVSLRNLSDVLIRFIGRRGFEEVQRCFVGVPAAGRIPKSQDASSNSSGSGKRTWQREDSDGQDISFADLLEDARSSRIEPGKNNDESITKMVAKVGRWWYSTCYEKALFPSDTTSIWHDQALLRECEKQGTSFRLLICHAQKPAQMRRRTVSV